MKTWLQTSLMVDEAYGCVDTRGPKLRFCICETVLVLQTAEAGTGRGPNELSRSDLGAAGVEEGRPS